MISLQRLLCPNKLRFRTVQKNSYINLDKLVYVCTWCMMDIYVEVCKHRHNKNIHLCTYVLQYWLHLAYSSIYLNICLGLSIYMYLHTTNIVDTLTHCTHIMCMYVFNLCVHSFACQWAPTFIFMNNFNK